MPSPKNTPKLRQSSRVGRLPKRCYFKHGAYYYVDTAYKWYRLGTTLPEALRHLAEIHATPENTMDKVFARYETVVLPTKAIRTQKSDLYSLTRLKPIFSHMPPNSIEPHHVWRYWETERKCTRQGRLEVGVLSHVFTVAMRWGLAKRNPCAGLRFPRNPPRRRYVSDEEFAETRGRAPERLQLAMDIALATGLRLTDILALRPESLSDEGLVVETSKTGVALCFTWTPQLRSASERWVALPSMTESGFTTAWQRLMSSVTKERRWQFRDLRAKSATDQDDEQQASSRLGHTSVGITRRVYIRKPRKVAPLDRSLDKRG